MFRRLGFLIVASLLPVPLLAQALPTATRDITFQAGGMVSVSSPDYTTAYIKGFTLYGEADIKERFGIEAKFEDLSIITPEDVAESSFLVSGLYRLNLLHHRLHPFGRAGLGIGTVTLAQGDPNQSSNVYGVASVGGGVDVYVSRRFTLRAIDYDYHLLSNFSNNGLTPYVVSVGGAYRF
jgi:hypothetical protein